MGGAQAKALDYAADSDGESPFPETSWHSVMRVSPKKVKPNPMWEATKWLEVHIETMMEDDPWWPLVAPLTDVGMPGASELAKHFHGSGWWRWPLPIFVHPPQLC